MAFSNGCVFTDADYRPRNPEKSLLYQVVALEAFLAAQQQWLVQCKKFSRSFEIRRNSTCPSI
jgi:hypothetical protein